MTAAGRDATRVARGDWQTPASLAEAVLARVVAAGLRAPRTVIEPTCGEGTFLVAAAQRFPRARVAGWEIDAGYTRVAQGALARVQRPGESSVHEHDFFTVDWRSELDAALGPILVVGNPPWVTSAGLGVLGSTNLPAKQNARGLRGLDAITGKSNFDVSEWMIVRLLEVLAGRDATLAMLCKSAVARRVVETVDARGLDVTPVGIWGVDAARHFDASVSAVLFVAETRRKKAFARASWPVYTDLRATEPSSSIAIVDGVLVADAARFTRTRHLAGRCEPEWRSGVKHDCARVMELQRAGNAWTNGLGERVDIEQELVHPLLKSSDVANDRAASSRAMIVTQRQLGEDTAALRRRAPRAWKYLSRHRALLDARKSSIYEKQPPFAVFGVGPYSFAPWKVAISGLYKHARFTVVGPHEGRPVVLDDTCYFLAFDDERRARRAASALRSAVASDFLAARIFWDAKRPITKAVLQSLDLAALERAVRR
ncbi:MAG: modification methylase NspV [Labilithrix sp.]|nr:modification methylase NspV [Labilithrix sp.]